MALSLATAAAAASLLTCAAEKTALPPETFALVSARPQRNLVAAANSLSSSGSGAASATAAGANCGCICAGSLGLAKGSTSGSKFFAAEFCCHPKMAPKGDRGRPENLRIPRSGCIAAILGRTEEDEDEQDVSRAKSGDYTEDMRQSMGTSLTYRHDLGMNYNHVLPDLIVGSCPQSPADVDRLRHAGVGTIFCLQQDSDLAYFAVDIDGIQRRARELEGIEHIREPIRDFDPYDLRLRLPKVVAALYRATKRNEGTTAYIHCTAGLGRAPGVALTYMHWVRGYDLLAAYSLLLSVRQCNPKLESIRAATADILAGKSTKAVVLSWKGDADYRVEIAGLDVGWYERIPLERAEDGHWYVERDVPVGAYEFKFIVDGNWKTNPDFSLSKPKKGQQLNNVIEVSGDAADAQILELRKKILADDFVLTNEHRSIIREKLEALGEG